MRDRVSGLYYPGPDADDITLKKCILLSDEVHFMDRPSFMFEGRLGMVGSASPLRAYEKSFREHGVPLYVHPGPGGIVHGELLENVKADISDPRYLGAFQNGLRSSARFRERHIAPGDYGGGETHQSIYNKLAEIDLDACPSAAWDFLVDEKAISFNFSSREGLYKNFFFYAAQNSVVLNFALTVGEKSGFSPIADAAPYGSLLSAKFARAIAVNTDEHKIPFSDLSLAIFDELVSPERLRSLTYGDIFKYRKESANAREAFLELLASFHAKAGVIPATGNYADSIQKVLVTEVRPAAQKFNDRLESIHESLFGKVKESTIRWVGGAGLAHLLAGLSWSHILVLGTAGIASAAVVQVSQARREEKAARRECAISYVLDIGVDPTKNVSQL